MSRSQVKGRSRGLLLPVLVVLVVVLGFSTGLTFANLRNLENEMNSVRLQLNTLNATYRNYMLTHSHSNAEYDSLQSAYNDYAANHRYTNQQYDALKSERDALKAPKISLESLKTEDIRRYVFEDSYLHIFGDVWNLGNETAYDVRLHILAYQGSVRAVDTYIDVGSITGQSKRTLDERVYYSGPSLTSWKITAEWRR